MEDNLFCEQIGQYYDVGNVPIANISPITYLANPSTGVLNPSNCSQPAMGRPFGGMVRIGGRIYNTGAPGTVRYQVQYALHGTGAWLPVTNSVIFELMHPNPFDPNFPKVTKTEFSTDGWIPYDEDPTALPPILERTNFKEMKAFTKSLKRSSNDSKAEEQFCSIYIKRTKVTPSGFGLCKK